MKVKKRNGDIVDFDRSKVVESVRKACIEVDGELLDNMRQKSNAIASYISNLDEDFVDVETIQDTVENLLMASQRKDVARTYIRYRYTRELIRDSNTTDKSIKELLDGTSVYWNTENSNKNARVVTVQRDYLAGITSTDITRRFLLPTDVVEADDEGIIHFHDKDYFAQKSLHNCFRGDEKFISVDGVRAFNSYQDGDKVIVPTHTRQLQNAVVKNYGVSPINKVVLQRGKSSKTVYVTPNHRWILDDGSITTNLSVGDKIFKLSPISINWYVVSIEPYGEADTWCLEVEDDHSFVLDGGVVTGNCELLNLEDVLQNGTVINGVMIEKPHRLLTATTIATQVIVAVTSSSYGGCTISLAHLAPFVRSSLEIYREKYKQRGLPKEQVEQFAQEDLKKEISDSVQTFNYQVNSMSNTNGQAPFLSVFMWVDEDKEYEAETAMLIEEFLHQRILGLKNETGHYITQAFPKLLYVLDENNITEDSKYWELTKLSARCTAKRFVPDYISAKIMRQNKVDKNGNGQVFPCMGCRSFLSPYVDENGKPKYYGRLTTLI